MKKTTYSIMILLFLTAFAGGANATLIDLGNGVVYDDAYNEGQGLYWYQDLDAFDFMTYSQQLTAIGNLYHAASGSWRMATRTEMDALWAYDAADIAGLFSMTYTEDGSDWWAGRYNELWDGLGHYSGAIKLNSEGGYTKYNLGEYRLDAYTAVFDNTANDNYGAWVATDTNPVPEPATLLLLGSGLVGFAGASMRKRFKRTHRRDQ